MKEHILLILNEDTKLNEKVIREFKHKYNNAAKISILYVAHNVHWASYLTTSYESYINELYIAGKDILVDAGEKLDVNKKDQWLKVGFADVEADYLAKKIHADEVIGCCPLMQIDDFKSKIKKMLLNFARYLQRHYGKRHLWVVE
jgi:hypothetical protein